MFTEAALGLLQRGSGSKPTAVPPRYFPVRGHLLLCTGPSCKTRGSTTLFAEVWRDAESEGIAYYKRGGTVRITEAGCLGACDYGPNVTCYVRGRDGALHEAWYAGVTRARALAVLRAIHTDAPLPREGRYDGPADEAPDGAVDDD